MRVEVGGGSVFTAPAGSPGAVRAVADGLTGAASRAGALGPGVRRGRDHALESWSGASAEAFASYAASLVLLVDGSYAPLREIGRALNRYADALEIAQRSIEAAAIVAPEAEGRREAGRAWRAYTGECAAVSGELESIAQSVAAETEGSRVVEVLSRRPAEDAPVHLSEDQWRGLQLSLLDLQGARGNLFGWAGYARFYERGAGSLLEQGRAWKASDDTLRVLHEALEGGNWGELFRGGLTADQLGPTLRRMGQVADVAGKSLGPLGVGFGGADTLKAYSHGDTARGNYNLVATGLGAATLFALPPPVGLVCGSASLAMVAGQVLYDEIPAVRDFVDGGVDLVQDVTGAVGDAVSDGWECVTDLL